MIIYNDWTIFHQKKIIFFTLRKNYAAAFINGTSVILLTDLNIDDKNYQFFIKPALEKYQAYKIDFITLKQDTVLSEFTKKDHQIIFNDYKIFLIDEQLNYKNISLQGNFSSLWFTGNSKYKLENLPISISYKSIIIDATNKDYKIIEFKQFADNKKVEVHILKKNPAYLIYLTQ